MEWKRYFSHFFFQSWMKKLVNYHWKYHWWITITGNNGNNHLPQIIIILLIFVSFYEKSRHFLPMKKLMIHKCLIQWDILYFHMSRNDVFWKISVPFSCIILIYDQKKLFFAAAPCHIKVSAALFLNLNRLQCPLLMNVFKYWEAALFKMPLCYLQ